MYCSIHLRRPLLGISIVHVGAEPCSANWSLLGSNKQLSYSLTEGANTDASV